MKKLNNDVYALLGPAEILYRTKAEEVMLIDRKFQLVLDKILRSMYYYNAIGFGAPQLGIYKRVITIDLGRSDIIKRSDNFYPKFCINPKVIEQSSEYNEDYESTPSLPGIKVLVKRPNSILLSFLDYNGNHQTLLAKGLLARVCMHEIDYLDGRLIIDYVSPLKRKLFLDKVKKFIRK